MPRLPRLHVPGGLYHVTLRGNHRHAIFCRNADYDALDQIVTDVLERSQSRLHAYCWMPNHLHLLVQIANDPLGRLMQRIGSQYARTFQSRLKTTGHLFERRYHCLLVDVDSYLLELVRYIHLNPVRAGIVHDPADFPWSSHRVYLGHRQAPWITTSLTLGLFHADKHRARLAYAAFMKAAQTDGGSWTMPAAHAQERRVLGGQRFLSQLPAVLPRPRLRRSLAELIERCCQHFNVSAQQLSSPSRCRQLARIRAIVAHLAITHRITSLQAVAHHFGRDESSLRRGVQRLSSTKQPIVSVSDLFRQ